MDGADDGVEKNAVAIMARIDKIADSLEKDAKRKQVGHEDHIRVEADKLARSALFVCTVAPPSLNPSDSPLSVSCNSSTCTRMPGVPAVLASARTPTGALAPLPWQRCPHNPAPM